MSEKQDIGQAWNRFWYSPADHAACSAFRILVGCMALYFIASHTLDLTRWFAADGLLPVKTIEQIAGPALFGERPANDRQPFNGRFSLLLLTESATQLWVLHVLAIASSLLMIVGLKTRIATIATLFFVLGYVHRAPFLCGVFEPLLTYCLLYLCIAPGGTYLSLDRRRRDQANLETNSSSTTANLAIRLIQLHTVIIVAMMTFTMLGSEELVIQSDEPLTVGGTWWTGTAVWDLINRSESRLLDLTGLAGYSMLLQGWTHVIVLFQMAFVILVWSSLTRRVMLLLAIPHWISLAILTGQTSFAVMMLIANLSFVSTDRWRSWLRLETAPA